MRSNKLLPSIPFAYTLDQKTKATNAEFYRICCALGLLPVKYHHYGELRPFCASLHRTSTRSAAGFRFFFHYSDPPQKSLAINLVAHCAKPSCMESSGSSLCSSRQVVQVFVAHASLCFLLGRWCVMPLSADQKIVLKSPGTKVKFEQGNPKTPGSKAYQRYDKYKSSNTIGEATQQGANWQDLTVDFEKGWLTTPDSPGIMDVDAPSGAKRAHTEGTPDREATIRAKALAREAEHHQQVETQKIEMSSATITASRMMLREEVTAIEERIASKVENSIQELKEELKQEKETRKDLEERVAKLENENKTHKPVAPLDDMDIVEKDRVVIGGFSDMDGKEAEKLVHEVLLGVPGYQGAYATNPAPSVVMAQFDSPAMALRAIRNQRFNPKMQEHKLWAS